MNNESLNRNLSDSPFVRYIEIAPTLAQIWFDHNAIELDENDVVNLHQQVGWFTSGAVIVHDNDIFDGVLELLIAPDYIQNNPDSFQRALDYITLLMRAAAPSCADYRLDRSELELELTAEETNIAPT